MALTNKVRKKKISKKQEKALKKQEALTQLRASEPAPVEQKPARKTIAIQAPIAVKELAEVLRVPVTSVIKVLMGNGILATINETVDFDTAAIVGDELGYDITPSQAEAAQEETVAEPPKKTGAGTTERPPVVTIMGHVDHGKTTLLDSIRKTEVASHESGGITQHIGAYQVHVETQKGKPPALVTFIDTPGHEAFSAMRAHGANVTDVVILVVAADEGVKPQTLEALQHAQAAHVPIIVAITKSDLPTAKDEAIKQELASHQLTPEEWGGQTVYVKVSGKTGSGVKELLDYIVLVASLKHRPVQLGRPGVGVILESHHDRGRGPQATVLVQDGTFRVGQFVTAGLVYGKIRSIANFKNEPITQATPGMPVVISGLNTLGEFADQIAVVENLTDARKSSEHTQHHAPVSITSHTQQLQIVLKADTMGSLAALKGAIQKQFAEHNPTFVLEGSGPLNESDLSMAQASNALVVGFRVPWSQSAEHLAERYALQVFRSDVIYTILEELAKYLEKPAAGPQPAESTILKIFRFKGGKGIIGVRVTVGPLKTGTFAIMRGDEEVGRLKAVSLHIGPEKVNSVAVTQECGLGVENATGEAPMEGDRLVASS